MAEQPTTQQVQHWIDRLHAGDADARDRLLTCACRRLERLTHNMLRGYPNVRRWEDTGDVLNNALLRLRRTLEQLKPATPRDYFRLAALHIRRELLDLARHNYGPQGPGAHHESGAGGDAEPADPRGEPSRLASWAEFHVQIGALPEEEREAFDLLWYQELTQAEAARVLGVSARTVKRRWQAARLRLYDALDGEPPG